MTTQLQSEYEQLKAQHRATYGAEKTCILMQVGSFYEVYQHSQADDTYLYDVSSACNFHIAKKENGVLMCGFPVHAIEKYIDMLLQNNYTIAVYDQSKNPGKKRRELAYITSPGINHVYAPSDISTYCVIVCMGCRGGQWWGTVSGVDVHTGHVFTYLHTSAEPLVTIGEVYKVVHGYNPREFLLHVHSTDPAYDVEWLHRSLEIGLRKWRHVRDLLTAKQAREELLAMYSSQSIQDSLHEMDESAAISLASLLTFVRSYDPCLVHYLDDPEQLHSSTYMSLFNNAMYQLSVTDAQHRESQSLLKLLNKCKTSMGKRLFRSRLLQPVCDATVLMARHDRVQQLLEEVDGHRPFESFRKPMSKIPDVEKLARRIMLSKIQPHEWKDMHDGYAHIEAILTRWQEYDPKEDVHVYLNSVHDICKDITSTIKLDDKDVYIVQGKCEQIDQAKQERDQWFAKLERVVDKVESAFPSDSSKHGMRLEYVEKSEQYFLCTTKSRGEKLKQCLQHVHVDGEVVDAFQFTWCTTGCRVTCPWMEKASSHYNRSQQTLTLAMQKVYSEFVQDMKRHDAAFRRIHSWVGALDVSCCHAKNAFDHSYTRPILDADTGPSFVHADGLRHAIVECVREDTEYVTNDIRVGEGGWLVYGTNASGKSCLMKAVGLAVIMAQSGMFVPCAQMQLRPYTKVMTRIISKDDLFRNQSTFTHEMQETRTILRHADLSSLVLGDELCSGTEHHSAVGIVTAGICWLANARSSFIFATHLHELAELEEIRTLQSQRRLAIKHLHVYYDELAHTLVFDRKLRDGTGSRLYGIELCKFLGLPETITEHAEAIRSRMLSHEPVSTVLSIKRSAYNKKLVVDKCHICKSTTQLETHHIRPQCEADKNKFIQGKKKHHKNVLHNLVSLCKECHDKVTRGTIEIEGYVDTASGRELRCKYI